MSLLSRTDRSVIGNWWWTIDLLSLGALFAIISIGVLLVVTASPAIADRIDVDFFYFVRRQLGLLPIALFMMISLSLFSPIAARRIAVIVFLLSLIALVFTLFAGVDIKGARRWLHVFGFSLQASEFIKPSFAIVAAWMFAQKQRDPGFPGDKIAGGLYLLIIGLLLAQPDMGQTILVTAMWGTQFFLAGLPLIWVFLLGITGMMGLTGAYYLFPHVASRINRFMSPEAGGNYQVERSLEAFSGGGLFGRGPGEGRVKEVLPDAHADFIFSVAGEEFGILLCLLIVGLFTFVVIRGFNRLQQDNNLFVLLAGAGLLVQFGFQSLVNMATALNLMPTKGMTLPFISYGGSSLLGLSFGMGILFCLTRRRIGRQAGDL